MVFFADQKALGFKIGEHTLAGFIAIKACIRASVRVHLRALIHHVNLRQVVALAGGEVVGIVRGRHLHRSGAEFRLRELIRDDGDLAIHQRQQRTLAVQMGVALVFFIHGDGGVAQHRLGPRGGDRNELIGPDHWIANLPQLALHFLVLHFEVGDGRLATRAPVDDVLAAINQALLIQPDEDLAHGAGKIFVHGEVFAVPINRRAEALHLVQDGAAVELLPFPNSLDEFLAAKVASLLAFRGQLALDHHLRGNAGMVCPRQPQRDEPAHAVPAHDDVHLRLVEHVAHVQAAGDVGRRQQQREHGALVARCRRGGGKQFFLDPVFGPARFNRARFVRFGQLVGHGVGISVQPSGKSQPQRARRSTREFCFFCVTLWPLW